MKTYLTNQIKNLVLLGNAGSGKTTLAESMLFEGGVIDRRGDISAKNTVSDYNLIEHENGSSIFSTVLYTELNDKKLNFIDVPGSDDFVGGTIAGLHIADTAILLINAQNGIEVGTEIHNRWIESFEKPMVILINHLDHDKANYDKALEMLNERFRGKIAVVQYPVNEGSGFDSIVDLIKMKFYKYPADGGKPQITDIPASELEKATELKAQLIEKAAENDEGLMELFFEKETLTEDEMRKGIHAGLVNRGMYPVFCVSGKKNIGVGRFMEFLVNVAPTPDEHHAPKDKSGKEIKCDAKGPASIFVFKTTIESHIGEVNYFKVMSGEITEGMDVINARTSNKERLSQIFASAGKNRVKLAKMVAGDIGSSVKLKATKNNDTLSINGEIAFPNIPFPAPKYRTAIKAVSESDDEKLGEALNRLHEEDPTLIIEYSKELKQIILHGQGEYHLNIVKWHLDHIFKIDTEYLTPKIPYRETITKSAQADYRHKKQSGGSGQFGEVHMLIEPFIEGAVEPATFKANGKEMKLSLRGKEEHELPWGGKLVYYNCIVGGSIDARFMPAILKGIMEKLETGPLTGSYARDIRVFVYDGKMHPVDSNEISFRLAGRNAFSQAFKIAGPKILEPIYLVEVLVPGDRMGDVMSDLQGRRAIVQGMSSERGFEKITAKVPLAEMNKYSTALSSITSGRAIYSMKYLEYAQVPGDVQETLLKAYDEGADDE
jgi:elongation factor G